MRASSFWTSTALALALLSTGASAADLVEVAPIAADEGLVSVVQGASLSYSLNRDESPLPQDYVAAARADYRRILTALYNEGYYGGTISIKLDGREAASIAPLEAPKQIGRVRIAVEPGPKFTFGALSLQAKGGPPEAPLPPPPAPPEAFSTGETARAGAITDAVNQRLSWARDNGYAKARLAQERITARHQTPQRPGNTLDADLLIDMGNQLSFGPLAIAPETNPKIRNTRLLAIMGYPQGEIVTPAERERVAQRLRVTGAFQSVSLSEAERANPDDTLNHTLTYSLLPAKRLGFSAELSSVEGLALNAFWMHRNLWGGAENLRFDASITGIEGNSGGPDFSLGAALRRPAFFGYKNTLFVDGGIAREDEDDYLRDSLSMSGRIERQIYFDINVSYGLGLELAQEEIAGVKRDYALLTFPLSGLRDKRNDPLNATAGNYLSLDVTPFMSVYGSESGVQLKADARYYRTFGKVGLAARGQAGMLFGPDLEDAPASYLFYSGGGGTVRGQSYRALGIPAPNGTRTGGASFYGAQLEARYQVTGKIGAVGFYDIGLIDAEPLPGDDYLWHSGAGIGVRYATPIGPIRLDIGTPANGDEAGKDFQFYIGIGQAF